VEENFKIEGYELLSQKVYHLLKTEIVKGFLGPGTKLLENKLAEEMQVSRTPIREAMRKLAAKGLVKKAPNQTIIVVDVSLEDIKEVLQIRGVLEGLAARIAAKKINRQEIDKLEKIVAKMYFYTTKKDLLSYCKADDKFHELILNICGNKWIIKMRNNLANFIYRYRIKSLNVPGRAKNCVKEHRKILSQIHMENTIINILKNVVKEDKIRLYKVKSVQTKEKVKE